VHQSKGKEFKEVFVAGVCQDILPHKRGVLSEEKRIMWVALTRAATYLTVTFFGSMSPFLTGHWDPVKQEEFEKQPLPGFKGQQTLFEGVL
jgi:superfamily I DNA/RNA helicase